MSLRFDDSAIQQVLDSVDIVEVISDYLVLKKSGSNYRALCPFHSEKTPSFTVNPEKQMFYCFGCQTGGNVFSFLMKHENMTFPETVRTLSEKAGIKLPEVDRGEDSKILSLMNLNAVATDYFHRHLLDAKSAERGRNYLSSRKINRKMIDVFCFGYAPGGRSLLDEVRVKGFSENVIDESGLFSKDKNHPVLANRIIFPIFNQRGKTIGFGGRTLGESEPKYINSPETPVYRKSESLYGLNLAKDEIRAKAKAIVVEGYFDVIQPFQNDIRNVVATLGTALTESQVRLLRRYTRDVIMLYDSDTPGVKATMRGLDIFVENGFRVSIVALPSGEDPDSFILSKGRAAFLKEVGEAKNLLDYKLQVLTAQFDPLTVEGRVEIVNEMLPTISKIGHAVERSEYVRRLANFLSIDEEAVTVELGKLRKRRRNVVFTDKDTQSLTPLVVERTLLQLVMENGDVLKEVKKEISPEDFSNADYRQIMAVVFDTGSTEPARVMSRLQDENLNRIMAHLLVKPLPYPEKREAVQDCIRKLKNQKVKRRRVEIQKEIHLKESQGDMEAVRTLLSEYQNLIRGNMYEKG